MLGNEMHSRYLHVGTSGLLLSFAHNCKLCSHRVLNWCIGRSIPVSAWKCCISVFGVFRCTLWCIPLHDSFTIWTGMPSKISCFQKSNCIFILNFYRWIDWMPLNTTSFWSCSAWFAAWSNRFEASITSSAAFCLLVLIDAEGNLENMHSLHVNWAKDG